MKSSEKMSVVIVDDEEDIRSLYQTVLEELLPDAEIFEACDGLEALNLIMAVEPDLVISDIKMPNMDGRRLLKVSREFRKSCQFIFISGFGKEFLYEFLRYGAFDVLEKPLNLDELEESISRALYCLSHQKKINQKINHLLNENGVSEEVRAQIFDLQDQMLKERYTNLLQEDVDSEENDDDDDDFFPSGGGYM